MIDDYEGMFDGNPPEEFVVYAGSPRDPAMGNPPKENMFL